MANLYNITQEYLDVLESIDIDPETGELLNAEKLDEMTGTLEDKFEAVACYIKNCVVLQNGIEEEIKALNERKASLKGNIERLKLLLSDSMTAAGYDKFESAKAKISFRKSQSVEIINEKLIPAEYVKLVASEKVDKKKLGAALKALKEGEEIAGAKLLDKKNIQIK